MSDGERPLTTGGPRNPELTVTGGVVIQKIWRRFAQTNSMAGVGIDPVLAKIPIDIIDPNHEMSEGDQIFHFCRRVIEATHTIAVDYKINANFFQSSEARRAMEQVFALLHAKYPEIIRVCDGKFADVGHTATNLAHYLFETIDADAVLLNPYLGYDALRPFLEYPDKAVILCINTSNPGANDIQNLRLENGQVLWRYILEKAMKEWNQYGNIIPVLSATHLDNLQDIRLILGETPIVLAGVGQQGGNLHAALPHVLDSKGYGPMISSSRSILYPKLGNGEKYFAAVNRAATSLRDEINQAKQQTIISQ